MNFEHFCIQLHGSLQSSQLPKSLNAKCGLHLGITIKIDILIDCFRIVCRHYFYPPNECQQKQNWSEAYIATAEVDLYLEILVLGFDW